MLGRIVSRLASPIAQWKKTSEKRFGEKIWALKMTWNIQKWKQNQQWKKYFWSLLTIRSDGPIPNNITFIGNEDDSSFTFGVLAHGVQFALGALERLSVRHGVQDQVGVHIRHDRWRSRLHFRFRRLQNRKLLFRFNACVIHKGLGWLTEEPCWELTKTHQAVFGDTFWSFLCFWDKKQPPPPTRLDAKEASGIEFSKPVKGSRRS